MLLAILSTCSQEELIESEEEEGGEGKTEEELAAEQLARRQAIRNKILAVGRMQRVFQLLRYVVSSMIFYCSFLDEMRLCSEEAENQTELTPGDAEPAMRGPDVLAVQGSINRSIKTFADA
jgi:serine/threonine-protein phosphatase 2B catalytic subunit